MFPFRIEISRGLTSRQLESVRALESVCNLRENLHMKLNWDLLKSRAGGTANDFFCWEGGQLVGYLAMYSFNTREAEISAMVHPDFRRRGIFRRLLAEGRKELQARGIPDFLFITEKNSPAARPVMERFGAVYRFSEYKMRYEGARSPEAHPLPGGLSLRPAGKDLVWELAALDQHCFGVPEAGSVPRFERMMQEDSFEHWLIERAGAVIGKIQVSFGPKETYIFGVCVLEDFRGQGIGSAVLQHVVARLARARPAQVVLEVEIKNEAALRLYTRSGFGIASAYDYYRLPVG